MNPIHSERRTFRAAAAALALVGLSGTAFAEAFCGAAAPGATQLHADTLSFEAGGLASVLVGGDGASNLDCWILDATGTLVASDEHHGGVCILEWEARRTGPVTLEIANEGEVSSRYCVEAS